VTQLRDRPKWIDGVPILVDTRLGVAYKGTDCLVFLEKLATIQPAPQPTIAPQEPPKKAKMSSLFEIEEFARAETDEKGSKKFSERSVSDLLDARASRFPMSKVQT
jgi:hypothetical protein